MHAVIGMLSSTSQSRQATYLGTASQNPQWNLAFCEYRAVEYVRDINVKYMHNINVQYMHHKDGIYE